MKKNAIAIILMIALFSIPSFADGDMSMPGKSCSPQPCPGFAQLPPDDDDSTMATQSTDQEGNLLFEFFEYFL